MPSVNLWEVMNTVASLNDRPNNDNCKLITEVLGPRFGTELSLEINPATGVWTVKIFDHQNEEHFVSLAVSPSGCVTVTRSMELTDNVSEVRKITIS